MTWYHVSRSLIEPPEITSVRLTSETFYDVAQQPGFSVAPTVWQCLLAIGRLEDGETDPAKRFIYEVCVDSPERGADHINDRDVIDEHRITESTLAACGGKVDVILIGELMLSQLLLIDLKIAFQHSGRRCSESEELTFLWTVKDRTWAPKFNGAGELENSLDARQ